MRVFISMPIVQHFDSQGNFDADAKRFYESYFEALRTNGIDSSAAVLMENWGENVPPRAKFTLNDMHAIESANGIVLLTRTKLTRDMFLELGIALGFGQKGVIILPQDAWVTEMLLGLEELQRLSIVRFTLETFDPQMLATLTINGLFG